MHSLVRSALLLATLCSACDVQIGECRRDDAGQCVDLFPDEPDASGFSRLDAATNDAAFDSSAPAGDSGTTVLDASSLDATVVVDASARRLTVPEFCTAVNARGLAWATHLDDCCLNNTERQSQQARTILNLIGAYSADSTESCIRFYNELVGDAGVVTFNPERAEACAIGFVAVYPQAAPTCPAQGFDVEQLRSTVGHGAPQLAQIPACRDAFRGRLGDGDPCMRNFECAPGLVCMPIMTGPSAGSRCRAPSTDGQPCQTSAQCAVGHTCVGSNSFGRTCRGDISTTQACEASPECPVGKVCTSGACTNPVLGDVICKQ